MLFVSCNTTKDLTHKTFSYQSKRRTLQLTFKNDSICTFKNIFHCNDIDKGIKELVITCKYKRVHDTIYLKNIECKSDSCNYSLTADIPIQNCKQCSFLNKENRSRVFTIGPSYITEYQKHGLIPNIDIDTLYVIKNKILLSKHDERMSVLFVFK